MINITIQNIPPFRPFSFLVKVRDFAVSCISGAVHYIIVHNVLYCSVLYLNHVHKIVITLALQEVPYLVYKHCLQYF